MNFVVEPDDLLASAVGLAAEMASCDRRAVRNLKRAYDEGALVTMAEGLKAERVAARNHMREVRPEDIAGRREAVQAAAAARRRRAADRPTQRAPPPDLVGRSAAAVEEQRAQVVGGLAADVFEALADRGLHHDRRDVGASCSAPPAGGPG